MRNAFLCDFDGTVSPSDLGAAFVRRFSRGRDPERAALLERWRAGALGHRALTEGECELVRATEAEARAFPDGAALDPHFAPFARAALLRGDAVMVVSEGFDFYIGPLLGRAGIEGLAWAANRARFEGDRMIPEFPFAATGCGHCGNCKAQHVEHYHARGFRTVMVGDGLSDRCGARRADLVLARGRLLEWCRDAGLAALPIHDFADVTGVARRLWSGETLP